jgi:glycosyltransferase involved in cell wall biosynthesis
VKICLLTREYPPMMIGGLATQKYDLAHAFDELGHEVHVISQALAGERTEYDGKVVLHEVGTDTARYTMHARADFNIRATKKLIELIRDKQVEIVETSSFGAEGLYSTLDKRIPLVVRKITGSRENLAIKNYSSITERVGLTLLSTLEYWTFLCADRLLLNTKAAYESWTLRKTKADYVPLGVDTRHFRFVSSNVREKYGLGDEPMILFVGSLELRKGVHVLYNAMKKVWSTYPSAKLVLVGRDTEHSPEWGLSFTQWLYKQANSDEQTKNLKIIPSVDAKTLVELYSACDVFVFPSFAESFGLVMVEAMACGKPAIGSNLPSLSEIIEDGISGSLFPKGDASKLADRIKTLLSDDKLREQMGRNARNRAVQFYDRKVMAKYTLESYSKAFQ